jgi:hypothetical protein
MTLMPRIMTSLAPRHDVEVIVHDFDFDAFDRLARGVDDRLWRIAHARHGGGAAAFGKAIAGQHDGHAKVFLDRLDQRGANRGRAGHRNAHRIERARLAIGHGQQGLEQGRRPRHEGRLVALHAFEEIRSIKHRLRQRGSSHRQAHNPSCLVSGRVEIRPQEQEPVAIAKRGRLGPKSRGLHRLAVSGKHALGIAGRAAGEHDVANIFGLERGKAGLCLLAVLWPCGCQERVPVRSGKIDCPAQVRQIETAHHVGMAHAEEFRRRDCHRRLRLVQSILHLTALESGIERNHHALRSLNAKTGDHPCSRIRTPQADPLARLKPRRDEGGRRCQHRLFKLGKGHVQVAIDGGEIVRP